MGKKKKRSKMKNKLALGKNLADTYKKLQLPSFNEEIQKHILFKS